MPVMLGYSVMGLCIFYIDVYVAYISILFHVPRMMLQVHVGPCISLSTTRKEKKRKTARDTVHLILQGMPICLHLVSLELNYINTPN